MDPIQKKKILDFFLKFFEMERVPEIITLSDHNPVSVPDDAGPSPSSPSPPPPSPSSLLRSLSLSTSATLLFQECCICLNDYNAKQDLNSVFNCGHQLCFRCSTSLLFDSSDYTINCPLCRDPVTKIVFCDYFVENHQHIDGQIFLRSFAPTILHCETEEVNLRCEERLLYKCTYGIDDECRSVNFWAPITLDRAQELFCHLSSKHSKYFCIICLLKFKPFANQMTMFNKLEYLDHIVNGVEVDGERVFHRFCTLCRPPYCCYDFEDLRSHCEQLHLKCRFCVENPVFARNRIALLKHINLVHPDSGELNRPNQTEEDQQSEENQDDNQILLNLDRIFSSFG